MYFNKPALKTVCLYRPNVALNAEQDCSKMLINPKSKKALVDEGFSIANISVADWSDL